MKHDLDYYLHAEANFTKEMVNDTLKYQKQYGFDIGENNKAVDNEADAFRHAYMQAYLSLISNNFVAKVLGDAHEDKGKGNKPLSTNMDLWNNEQGRQIADKIRKEYPDFKNFSEEKLKDIIANKVVINMYSGQLITNLDDKRKYTDKSEHFSKPPFTPMLGIGGVQKNGLPTGFAADIEHTFTREEIDKMSIEEYQKNEKAIMKQLKEKGIPRQKELEKTKHYQNKNGRWVTIDGNHVFIEE